MPHNRRRAQRQLDPSAPPSTRQQITRQVRELIDDSAGHSPLMAHFIARAIEEFAEKVEATPSTPLELMGTMGEGLWPIWRACAKRALAKLNENRKQPRKRKAKTGLALVINYGHVADYDDEELAVCYLCAASHAAFGLAAIEDKSRTIGVPLCDECFASPKRGDAIAQKYLAVPDLQIDEGGPATVEQILAVAEKQEATEH